MALWAHGPMGPWPFAYILCEQAFLYALDSAIPVPHSLWGALILCFVVVPLPNCKVMQYPVACIVPWLPGARH